MTTRYRMLTVVVLAGLLLSLAAPVVALAQGPGMGSAVSEPMHRGGGHGGPGHGPGHGGHGSGWGRNAMVDAFANALGMTPSALVEEIENGKTIAQLIEERQIDREELVEAVVDRMSEGVDSCLQAGHIDEEQRDWVEESQREHINFLIDNSQALLYEWQHGGPFGPGWGHGFGGLIWAAADVLGISTWEVRDALYQGQTIAEFAGSDETTIGQIIDKFMEPREAAANAAVQDGRLTQEQADEWLEHMRTYAEWLVQNTPPMGQFGHGYGGGCH